MQNETIEIDDESQPAPEPRKSVPKDLAQPEGHVKRTHEINELVSKEELALLLSNEFLFGHKIEIDKEKAK